VRIVLEDEDRRSVRAILRGAAAGAASEARLAGLIPTPALPERLLEELAAKPTPKEVAALLAVWGHPFGPAAVGAASVEHPDLFRLELEIDRVFAARAVAGARRGGPVLRAFVADAIDYANAMAALVLAAGESEQPPASAFLAGGRRLDRQRFLEAVAAGAGAGAKLAAAFGADEAALLQRHAGDAGALERELLALRIRRLRDLARRDPLGSAPLLLYFLRLRAEQENLRLLLWGAALGAPDALRRDRLVPSR
jgi:vacuolar-type H+-ATPase subunit C/Vma6